MANNPDPSPAALAIAAFVDSPSRRLALAREIDALRAADFLAARSDACLAARLVGLTSEQLGDILDERARLRGIPLDKEERA